MGKKYVTISDELHIRIQQRQASSGGATTAEEVLVEAMDVFEGIENPKKTGMHWVREEEWLDLMDRISAIEKDVSKMRVEASTQGPVRNVIDPSGKERIGHFTKEGLERMREISRRRLAERGKCPKCSSFLTNTGKCRYCDEGIPRFIKCPHCGDQRSPDQKKPCKVCGKVM